MARWAPVASTGALTAIALGLLHPAEDSQGRPTTSGLVETIAKRAASAV
jgi:hypothetical protein